MVCEAGDLGGESIVVEAIAGEAMVEKGCGSLGILFRTECMDYLRHMSVTSCRMNTKPSVHNLHAL